jgi:hypothetical protein
MLTGGVEVIMLTWILLGMLLVVEIISGDLPRAKIAMRFAASVFLITCLCAAQLLPFFDLLEHSQRQGNYFAEESPIPATGWVNFFLPLFRCEQSQGVFFQSGQYWILYYYSGVITVALAALAIYRRCRHAGLLGILTVFCVIAAMGNSTPLYPWLNAHVPVIGFIRFPSKFLILPAFALPLMAAGAFVGRHPQPVNQKNISFANPWFLLWLVATALITICLVWESRLQASRSDNLPVLLNGLVRASLFTVLVFCLFILDKAIQSKLRRWLQVLVLLFIWLDLDRLEPQPATVNSAVLHPGMSRSLPAPQFGSSRAIIPPDVLSTLTFAVQSDPAQNFLSHRFALFSDCNLLDDIPKCDGLFPLDLGEHALLYGNLGAPMQDFLDASETLIVRSNILDWATRSTFMPLLTGGQKPVFADDAATLSALASTNFNPRAQVYLPSEARGAVTVTNTAAVEISAERFSAGEIDTDVEASAPTVLVAAQSYYHPWHAYVDGENVPLFRANYAFQAVAIPQGKHKVRLVYQDRAFEIGAAISVVTWLACLFYCLNLKIQSSLKKK